MDRVVDVEAGQNGEHIGLQKSDQEFEPGQRNDERQGQNAADDAEAEKKLDQQFAAAHCGGPPEPADGGASSHAQVSISTGILGSHQAGRGRE